MARNYRKWTSVPGLPSLRPSFPFGNMGDIYMQRKPFFDGQLDVFKQLEGHKYVLHLKFHQFTGYVR